MRPCRIRAVVVITGEASPRHRGGFTNETFAMTAGLRASAVVA